MSVNQRCHAAQQQLFYLCAIIFIICCHERVASASSAFVPSASSRIFRCTDNVQELQYLHNKSIICLSATSNDSENTGGNKSKSARERGIYARPSAAIERGSGFFIPGLEGSRIRLIFGMIVLIADGTSHALVESMPGDWGQVVAEVLAAFYGVLLVLQGSIEMGVERGFALKGDSSSSEGIISIENEDGVVQNRGSRVADALKGNEVTISTIQRMAQTVISFTPATYFQFVSEDLGVLYSFGVENDASDIDINEQKRMAKLSLDAVSGSKGGRVALPSDHPASKLLPEDATRCILVQKVNDYQGSRACMVIGSDKLLPSFTKNDLRWIGQLAEYNNLMGITS